MKRITVILLMLLYLVPSIGLTVSAHHCGGKIASYSLRLLDLGEKCPCGKKPMKKDCCKEEAKIFKLKSEQQKSHQLLVKVFTSPPVQPIVSTIIAFGYTNPSPTFGLVSNLPPPDDLKHPLYLRHRDFRI